MVQSFHLRITSLGWQWLCLELWVEKDSECHDELMMSARGAGRDVTACVSGIFSSLIDPFAPRSISVSMSSLKALRRPAVKYLLHPVSQT